MSKPFGVSIGELGSLSLLIVTGILLLIGSAQLPPPEFDPLGPAGMPRYIAFILLGLSVFRIFSLLRDRNASTESSAQKLGEPMEIGKFTWSSGIVAAYLVALTVGGIPFSFLSCAFLVALGVVMTGGAKRKLPIIVAIAVTISFGLTYIFTELLTVVLPE